jgi:hypothetical protein
MSDIVPGGSSRPEAKEKKTKESVAYGIAEDPSKKNVEPLRPKERLQDRAFEEPKERWRMPRGVKIFGAIVILLVLGFGIAWGGGKVFGKAEVTIGFKQTPWQTSGAFSGSKVFAKIDSDKKTLPAESFSQSKNGTWLFPATGRSDSAAKATGKLTIYNAYSAASQTLVATTRFQTADGKIFRLDSGVTIPGAKIENGKITPSSVDAAVTADQPGAAYNISSSDHLMIPGFKGTPRYNGFYAVLSGPTTGGGVGDRPVPTDQDMAAAKDKATQNLKDALMLAFQSNRPAGFTILDGASDIQITKLNVGKSVDQNGDFTVFGEAQFRAVGFKEDDVKAILNELAGRDTPNTTFRDLKLTYSNVKPNFDAGQISFSLAAEGTLGPSFSAGDFAGKIAGRPVDEARQIILALPGLTSAKISLLPFWLSNLPSDPKRVKIVSD